MYLPHVSVNLISVKGVEEKLKIILLNVLEKGDRKMVESALWTLKENIKDIELLPLLREISKKSTIEGSDIILSKRLLLGDSIVWEEIMGLANNKSLSTVNFYKIKSAIEKIASSKLIPYYLRIIDGKNNSLREGAMLSFSDVADIPEIPYLGKLLYDNNSFVRFRTVYGLSKILGPIKKNDVIVPCTFDNYIKSLNLWKK